jgi:hypothetical protein
MRLGLRLQIVALTDLDSGRVSLSIAGLVHIFSDSGILPARRKRFNTCGSFAAVTYKRGFQAGAGPLN